jgi:hypothetical protein
MTPRSSFGIKGIAIAAILAASAGLSGGALRGSAQEVTMPDSNSSNGEVLTQVLKKMRSGEKVAPSEFQDFVKAQNDGATTGLQVGERIPDFALTDQDGNQRRVRDLTGPSGLLPRHTASPPCPLTSASMNAKFERTSMDPAKSRADRFRRNPPISAAGHALRVHTFIADRAHTRGFRAILLKVQKLTD